MLSFVERGWRAARECSLRLQAGGIPVTHLIKGSLDHEVRAMIQPYPLIEFIDVPRYLYRLRLWGCLAWRTATRRIRWVLVDNERTLGELGGFCRRFGISVVLAQDAASGYELRVAGCVVTPEAAFGLPGGTTSRPPARCTCHGAGRGGRNASRNAGR